MQQGLDNSHYHNSIEETLLLEDCDRVAVEFSLSLQLFLFATLVDDAKDQNHHLLMTTTPKNDNSTEAPVYDDTKAAAPAKSEYSENATN
ncbi:34769_t:CDS:2 [Racocetra persica]|uniref:34769_t:CDS:1 n=1 Tax=Racocetra persica TaxID=160502 RepID=A0ACA9L5I7_9GLOM|nr:34769_t:CDS:2 [Racocetra persica]